MDQTASKPIYIVPTMIKRNIVLFALAQSFTGAGMLFAFGLGPLMVLALTHSASLSGLTVALMGLSRFLVAYPIGKITDTYGRKPGVMLGLIMAAIGAVIVSFSMSLHSITVLIVGMLMFGMGVNAAQQLRVAATDMFPPSMRAQGLGYVSLGSAAGLVIGPPLIAAGEAISLRLGQDPLGLPWLMLPGLIISGMVLIYFVRPDPKQIGMNLQHYYPNYIPRGPAETGDGSRLSIRKLLADGPIRLAIVANAAAMGNMSIVMVLTSLVLSHHGHSVTAIALSHGFHSAGMFAFTIPIGKLADRFGRDQVMLPGVAVALFGALLVAFTESYLMVTLGTFLVGLGWAAANVASTALIADHVETAQRGRAIGLSDSFAGAISVAMALAIGPLIEHWGLAAAGVMAALVAAVPLVMWITARRKPAS